MVRGAHAGGHPVAPPCDPDPRGVVVPFLLGTAVGGVAGAVVGTALSHHTTHLMAAIIGHLGRRLSDADRDEPQFELLLQ